MVFGLGNGGLERGERLLSSTGRNLEPEISGFEGDSARYNQLGVQSVAGSEQDVRQTLRRQGRDRHPSRREHSRHERFQGWNQKAGAIRQKQSKACIHHRMLLEERREGTRDHGCSERLRNILYKSRRDQQFGHSSRPGGLSVRRGRKSLCDHAEFHLLASERSRYEENRRADRGRTPVPDCRRGNVARL